MGKGQLSAFTVDNGYEADSEMSSDVNCGTDKLTCCNTIRYYTCYVTFGMHVCRQQDT